MIIQVAVPHSIFKKVYENIDKNHLQFLVTPTNTTTDPIALKFFANTIQSL